PSRAGRGSVDVERSLTSTDSVSDTHDSREQTKWDAHRNISSAAIVSSTLRLLHPEWQAYGLGADVHRGATALAAAVFADTMYMTIDAPEEEALHVVDGVLGLHSIAPRLERTMKTIRTVAPDRIAMIGGTCGVEVGPIGYLNERYSGDLAVLWLDAHADLNTPASSPSGHFDGMPLRTRLGDGPSDCARHLTRPLRPDQVVLLGVRDVDPPEADFIQRHDIARFDDEVFRDPSALLELLAQRGFRHAYVHFDVDVLDPAAFPAALMRAPGGGPGLDDAIRLIASARSAIDVVGLSVLEFCARDAAWTARVAEAVK